MWKGKKSFYSIAFYNLLIPSHFILQQILWKCQIRFYSLFCFASYKSLFHLFPNDFVFIPFSFLFFHLDFFLLGFSFPPGRIENCVETLVFWGCLSWSFLSSCTVSVTISNLYFFEGFFLFYSPGSYTNFKKN